MKVLILHRYFWPQAYPYAQMLKYIAEEFSGNHSVSVLTTYSKASEEEKLRINWSTEKDITVQAITLSGEKRAGIVKKAFNSLVFGTWVLFKLTTTKTDIVMVATTPPVIIAMIVRWVSKLRNFKYIYHCQDIHPEAMMLAGAIQKDLKYSILLSIDKKNINQAWKVITLSGDMKKTISDRGCKSSHIYTINNFIYKKGTPNSSKPNKNQKIQFLFAGSLGRLQNLDILMESLLILKGRKDVCFTFMGDGVMFKALTLFKQEHELTNVTFLGQRSPKEAVMAMQSADIGIVSLASNICKVAYPSKTMMYLGNGLPILALVDEGTEIYQFINSNNLGMAVSPKSSKEISSAIITLIENLKKSPTNKKNVIDIAESSFGKKIILPKFLEVLS